MITNTGQALSLHALGRSPKLMSFQRIAQVQDLPVEILRFLRLALKTVFQFVSLKSKTKSYSAGGGGV